MTRREAYLVAEKMAFVDCQSQYVLRRILGDCPDDSYRVLSVADPAEILGMDWIIENYYDCRNNGGDGAGWLR